MLDPTAPGHPGAFSCPTLARSGRPIIRKGSAVVAFVGGSLKPYRRPGFLFSRLFCHLLCTLGRSLSPTLSRLHQEGWELAFLVVFALVVGHARLVRFWFSFPAGPKGPALAPW